MPNSRNSMQAAKLVSQINKVTQKLVLGLWLMAAGAVAQAQVLNPAKWSGRTSVEQAKVGDVVELVFLATIDADWYMYSNDFDPDLGPNLTSFEFRPNPAYELVGKPQAVGAKKKFDKIWEGDVTYFTKTAEFRQKVKVLKPDFRVEATATYQLCSDVTGQCLPPTDADVSFALKVTGGEPSTTTDQAKPANQAENPDKAATDAKPEVATTQPALATDTAKAARPDSVQPAQATTAQLAEASVVPLDGNLGSPSEGSLFGLFFFAFMSGLAALLTPCVFPMIPMTVSFFLKNSENRAQAVTKGLVFGLSIMAIFTIIGTLFSLIFGTDAANLLATHWLPNSLFFIIFIIFALSFFGLFDITLPSGLVNKIDQQSERGGYLGVFFMAFTLALVSFSCTGPIVGTVLVQSATGEFVRPVVAMTGFSLAFALPFSLFAIFPNWMQNLPKSGGWLNSVKVVLGFIELALALKFLSMVDLVYHWGILDRHVYIALWAAIGLFMGLYLLGKLRLPHDSPIDKIGVWRMLLALATFSFVIYLLPGMFGAPLKALSGYLPPQSTHDFDLVRLLGQSAPAGPAPAQAAVAKYSDRFHLPHGLTGYFEYQEGLAAAKKAGKPIFIDFTGHGCANCREMEANVWSDPAVLQRLRNDYVVIALYVDDRLELPESEWVTSTVDNKVKKTLGKVNSDFQIAKFNNNAQPFYVLLDQDGKLLVRPKVYDLDVKRFADFLDSGTAEFRARQGSQATK
jgi:thiol:disulfide interchange protein